MKNLSIIICWGLSFLVLFSIPTNVSAQVRKGGIKTINKRQPSADEIFKKADDYYYGQNGVSMNKEKGFELYLQAAKMGHAWAQAMCTANEKLSNEERVGWAKKSADMGCWLAMDFLQLAYHEGTYGLPKDTIQAAYWIKRWSETGELNGMYLYALHIITGYGGVSESLEKGISLLENVAENNTKDITLKAKRILFDGYKNGYIFWGEDKYYFPKNKEKYFYWTKKMAEMGDIYAQYHLSQELEEQDEKWYDIEMSQFWLMKLWNNTKAREDSLLFGSVCCALGDIEEFHHKNYQKAEEYYREGIKYENIPCMFFLSECISAGFIKEQSTSEFFTLLLTADRLEHKNDNPVLRNTIKAEIIGQLLCSIASGSIKDDPRPLEKQLIQLAEQGNSRAMAYYGNFLMAGYKKLKIKKDQRKGKSYIINALNQGDRVAGVVEGIWRDYWRYYLNN